MKAERKPETQRKVYMVPNPPMPNIAIEFNAGICNGCNQCVNICRTDVLMPNPEKGCPPIVLYPDECWHCGCCVLECKRTGAIKMIHPLNQSVVVSWKRKQTGAYYRLGKPNPQPDNRPPMG